MAKSRRTPSTASLKESTSTLRDGGTMDERIRAWQDELAGFEQESGKLGQDNVDAARAALEALIDSAGAFQSATFDNYQDARKDLEEKWSAVERAFRKNRRVLSGGAPPLV